MHELKPNYGASAAFLRQFRSSGFWILTAVKVAPQKGEDKTITRPFAVTEEDALVAWLEEVNRYCNVYFHVNPTIEPVHKKASREQIKAMDYLHVDIDPRPGEPLDAERDRAIRLLTTELPQGVPPPSYIIDSGGGAWGFWELKTPFVIDGESSKYEEAMRFNLQLEILFGADHCHNVDRIARLPGTINWPNQKKLDRGQVPVVATLVANDGYLYELHQFTPAPLVQHDSSFTAGTVKVSGNIQRLGSVHDLPESVSALCKMVIVQGKDPDNPDKWSSRSEPLFWVCCELVRAQIDDDTIFSIITDPGFAISESVLDKGGRAEKYAVRQIERAREEAIHPMLRELNEKHAVIGDINGKCRIISHTYDESLERTTLTFQSFEDFHHRYGNRFVEAAVGAEGKIASIPLGKWWTAHQHRRQFEGIIFYPGKEQAGYYNLWQGFGCDARPGRCDKFLAHIKDNICSGDEGLYKYLIGWMATAVQFPNRQGEVAIVMRGKKGTGKGTFATLFGRLFGRHYLQITNSEHLVGRFNDHLRDCVVLFADEAFYAGNKGHEAILKAMVTEDMVIREGKGANALPTRNYLHILMASNNEWVVPAGADERRYFMLDVKETKMQDLGYFKAIKKEYYEQGGREALLHMLLNYPLENYESREVPKTDALQEQKQHSFSVEQEWWFQKLKNGEVFEGGGWPSHVICAHLAFDFTSYVRTWGNSARSNATKLGRFLQAAMPNHFAKVRLTGRYDSIDQQGHPVNVDRPHAYRLPPLDECRTKFVQQFIGGSDFKWPGEIPIERDVQHITEDPF